MKKFITLLLLTLTALTFKSNAQNTSCTAQFSYSVTNNYTVHFTPAQVGDTLTFHHTWTFGDGSSSSAIFPTHTYPGAGSYLVHHVVYRDQPPGVPPCFDSVTTEIHLYAPLTCTLVAHFSTQAASGTWNRIYFTNLSTPAADIHSSIWSFGDGTSAYTLNAYHLYANAGTYNVCLIVTRDSSCRDTSCMAVVVVPPTPIPCTLVAHFSSQASTSTWNGIYFTNLSTPSGDVHTSHWSFGDGTSASTLNAYHLYANAGTYNVCLIVTRDSTCRDTSCMSVVVIAPPPPPTCNLVANFTWFTDSVQINKIHFTNLSVPLAATDSIRWTFGDGSSSLDVNPIHVYNAPGTYTVCLRVKKNVVGGTTFCVKEICKQVVAQVACTLNANFSFHADSLNSLKIHFINQSNPASTVTYVQWTFGDGTSSTAWNPDHTYAQAGTYNVCLNLSSGAGCYSTFCKQVLVLDPINCLDISKFSLTHSTANCLEFNFVPDHLNPTWQYHWTFGDGTASNTATTSHVYAQPGNYTVCLSVTRSLTCASTTCKPISTGLCFSCNNVWVRYSYVRDPNMPNRLYFHGQSNYPITSETWTFTKISPASTIPPVVLNQFDPVFVFPEPGYYRVCLRAITYGGCVKEYCEVIYIGQVNTACTLQSYPNPTHNTISVNVVETTSEMIHVYIYNSLNILVGQKDQQGYIGSNIVTVNVETLLPGTYTMRVIYGNHVCYSQFQKI